MDSTPLKTKALIPTDLATSIFFGSSSVKYTVEASSGVKGVRYSFSSFTCTIFGYFLD